MRAIPLACYDLLLPNVVLQGLYDAVHGYDVPAVVNARNLYETALHAVASHSPTLDIVYSTSCESVDN